ncbi:Vacuolar protein sorting-associated protein 13, VPS13 adaptor binding domain, partial [Dillenia turbinata]
DLPSADQAPQNALLSIQLAVPGTFLTSPVHLSLLEAQTRAWRTRILSQHDSRTYPGPFIVVDISRKAENGLSIAVSPLLRVHNETEFAMELRFQRPQVKADFASILLNAGDMIDDCMAVFDAVGLSGGSRKALMSLTVGNFLYSFRPQITDTLKSSQKIYSVEWSEDLKGGKAVRISGIFDKLSYTIRKAFSVEPFKYSFSCACCSVKFEDASVGGVHFMIQTIVRDIPVMQPNSSGNTNENTNAVVALQVQKEIFLFPTVRVTNLLQSEICVLLSETGDLCITGHDKIGKEATIAPGSKVNFYANPSIMYFMVTMTAFNSSCKPVNSGEWVKKLQKRKSNVNSLDINLEFGVGKYFATLRLYRGDHGILEAVIFTSYTLKNDTDFPLICLVPNLKILPREEVHKFCFSLPPEVGVCLAPNSMASWFAKSSKVILKLLEGKSSEALLDLDSLSGLTEISLEMEGESGALGLLKLGAAVGLSTSEEIVPSQMVTMVPRYVVCNESEETVIVRQCYLENDMEGMIYINSKQKTALQLHKGSSRREISPFDNFVRKHRTNNDSVILIQFRLDKTGLDWSGPVCIASLGRFYLKFRRSSDFLVEHSHDIRARDDNSVEFAVVQVAEEGSSIVSHFYRSPNITLPYRIENLLHSAITYYQKNSLQPETLKSGSSVDYVWDDSTLPHMLIVHIDEMHLLREINLDKVRAWKPFYKSGQKRGLATNFLFDKTPRVQETMSGEVHALKVANVGYEVYTDGSTRVLKVCELDDCLKVETIIRSCTKVRFRVSSFAVSLVENQYQAVDATVPSDFTTITVARLGKLSLNSVLTDHLSYYQISMQNLSSLNVDQKWVGAPFPSMLRRHRVDHSDATDNILSVILILQSTSKIMHVKHLSIILQPIDLNLDEETLMKVVPFWRRSLSDANGPSVQFYFDHFEIHPIKITANFLPGDSFASYSSAQETLRSLLHSVIKIPTIRNMVVELNGVLVTHALVTTRELLIKCAQHYSWYALRAIYIAKGSQLLPPSFVSVFDDLASSSLDVFFDPSSGSINLPGLSIGTFKFISKCIDKKGFSGTKRYFGDLGKTLRNAGSNVLFAAVTEISDSVLKGAEASGFKGMLTGFHQGILRLAMEPSMLQTAFMEGGPERKIKLDQSPGVDELYIEGYLQAMLDTVYSQEYLRVRVIDNEVVLKNLPPSSALIDEIMNRVKDFLVSKELLKGDSSTTSRPLRHLRGASEWKIGPTVVTLCEHLFVSFAIRILRKQASKFMGGLRLKALRNRSDDKATVMASNNEEEKKPRTVWKWGIGKFALSGMVAYVDGRLCRCIPHPLARRIITGL